MTKFSAEQQKVIEQVTKLLALSKSENENEAALALAKAEALLEKYRLDMTTIEMMGQGKEEIIEDDDPLFDSENIAPWESRLAHGIAYLYGCTTLRITDLNVIRCIGRASDIMFVRYLVTYITIELFRFSAVLYKKRKDYKDAWFLGAVDIILVRLKQAKEEAQQTYNNKFAVVTINNRYKESLDWLKEQRPNLSFGTNQPQKQPNSEAYNLGREAGRKIKLTQDKKLLAKPTLT